MSVSTIQHGFYTLFIYSSDALRHLFTFSENAAVSQRGRLNKLKYKKSMYVHLIALKRGDARHTGPAIALRRHTHSWIEGGGEDV